MAVNVNSIQAGDEIDEDVVDTFGDFLEQRRGDLVVGGEFLEVDGYKNLFSFGVNITNVDTAFVCEENPVALRVMS